jgi:hypothetical protein
MTALSGTADLARLVGWHRPHRGRHGAPGLRSTTHPLRRARLARDVLHDRDGALTRERDGHRVGAHALARDATGGVAGIEIVAVGIAAEETESDGESVEVDW